MDSPTSQKERQTFWSTTWIKGVKEDMEKRELDEGDCRDRRTWNRGCEKRHIRLYLIN